MKALSFLLLAGVLFVTGCQSPRADSKGSQTEFTKFRVTNYRGDLIADWVAEGKYQKTDRDGYLIKAVERTSGPPYSQTTRYPNGWNTTVAGPHIIHWLCPKPRWLAEMDGFE